MDLDSSSVSQLLVEDSLLDVDHEEIVESEGELDLGLLDNSTENIMGEEDSPRTKQLKQDNADMKEQMLKMQQMMEDQRKQMEQQMESQKKQLEEMQANQASLQQGSSGSGAEVLKFFNYPVPEMTRDQTYADWRHSIALWKLATPIPPKDIGLAIALKLPTKDNYGGLQRLITQRITPERLRTVEGFDLVMKELDTILQHPLFLRLVNWQQRWDGIMQKPEDSIEAHLHKIKQLAKLGSDDFGFEIPDQLVAAKILLTCQGISSNNISIITHDIDLEVTGQKDGKLVEQVEQAVRKHITTTNVMDTKKNAHQVLMTGIFGERLFSNSSVDTDTENEVLHAKHDKRGERDKKPRDRKRKTRDKDSRESKSKSKKDDKPAAAGSSKEREPETIDQRNRRLIDNRQCLECESKDHTRPNCQLWKDRMNRTRSYKDKNNQKWEDRGNGSNRGKRDDEYQVNIVAAEDNDIEDIEVDIDPSMYLFDRDDNGVYSSYVTYNVKHAEQNMHLDRGILDSGCQRSVCGIAAAKALVQQLHPDDRKEVQVLPSDAKFRFGDGQCHQSKGAWMVPTHIGGTKRFIMFDVVQCQLPLLLSMKFMQKIQMNLCHRGNGKDFCQIDGADIKLHYDQGHNWLSLTYDNSVKDIIKDRKDPMMRENSHQVYMSQVEVFTPGKEYQQIKQLHTNLAHPPKPRLISAIKATGNWSKQVSVTVDKVYQECPTKKCREKDQIQKPANASFKVVKEMGDLVSADLKISSSGKNILYLIDHATSYAVSALIENKTTQEIIDKIIMCWYSPGLPRIKCFLSDNGQEFNGHAMASFLQSMSTIHINTCPYTPQQNGLCERVHGLIDLNMAKLQESNPSVSQEQCLTWATYAHNQSESRSGFSPMQMVYGVSDNMTSNLTLTVGECENWDTQLRYANSLKCRREAVINHLKFRNSTVPSVRYF